MFCFYIKTEQTKLYKMTMVNVPYNKKKFQIKIKQLFAVFWSNFYL